MNNLIVKIVVIISLLLFGSIAYEKYANTKDTMEDYINKYNQYRGKVDSTNKMVDSLKTIIAIEANEAHAAETRANGFANNSKKSKAQLDSLRSETDSLRKTIKDSTEMARVIIPKLDSVEFRVVDDGIGVPEAQKSKLFDKFFRADNAKKERPSGSGIGQIGRAHV